MLSRMTTRARADQGFTILTVILSMMVLSMLAAGAFAASLGDTPVARKDQDRKRAYEAAQAGVDWYMSMLRADPDYWKQCAPGTAAAPTPSNAVPLTLEGQPSRGAWTTVDNGEPQARFRVEILNGTKSPVAGGTPCDDANPGNTALDPKGRMWIRATGVANGKIRSIIAGLQQKSEFLKYVLFTNWESQDPQLANATYNWYPGKTSTDPPGNVSQCDYPGLTRDQAPYNQLNLPVCPVTRYDANDQLLGSVHTNDDGIRMCAPTVGRNSQDTLEVAGAPSSTNWKSRSDKRTYADGVLAAHYTCLWGPDPAPVATVKAPAPVLQLPPSNVKMLKLAESLAGDALIVEGQTCMEFRSDGKIEIQRRGTHGQWGSGDGSQADPKRVECDAAAADIDVVDPPASGLIYVKNQVGTPCTPRMGHNAMTSYSSSPSCGDLAVKGKYGKSVTIAAENDIIITGDLERANDTAMLGLIGNGFVRIYHPVTEDPIREANQEMRAEGPIVCTFWWGPDCIGSWVVDVNDPRSSYPCPNFPFQPPKGRMLAITDSNIFTPVKKVQAAIISMKHTLIVDNLACPGSFSTGIEFEGSLAVYWGVQLEGCVVLLGCAGYPSRKWTYDDRFKTQQPPHFIAPLNSDGRWLVSRRTEQVPTPVGGS